MQSGDRTIAVVGTINRDTILTADGVRTESYGGVLDSVLALAAIAAPDTVIYPVCNVGRDVEDAVRRLLSPCVSVRLDGIQFVPEQNAHCFLEYDAEGRKRETLLGGGPPLTVERLRPFLSCDAVCYNFITGMELTLETFCAGRGPQAVHRGGSGQVIVENFEAYRAGDVCDETGCGDVFLMGFTWGYLESSDVGEASRLANRVAGINCCLRGSEGVPQLGTFFSAAGGGTSPGLRA